MRERRGVKQLSMNGDVLAVYDKMEDAARITNTNYANICLCCRGKLKSSNGFKWIYDNSKLKQKKDPLDNVLDFTL